MKAYFVSLCRFFSRMTAFMAKLARLTTGQAGLLRPVGQGYSLGRAHYNCWSCSKHLNKFEQKQYFCPCEKQVILPVDSSKDRNFFEMFNLKENFKLDDKVLTNKFRQLIRKLHPDIFNTKSEVSQSRIEIVRMEAAILCSSSFQNEKQYSADQSRMINKAYRTLASPISRAIYLLKLNNVSYAEGQIDQANDQDPGADQEQQRILLQIMELNETIDEIQTNEELEELEKKLEAIMEPFEKQFEQAFTKRDFSSAVKIVAKMKYFKNIDERLKDLKLEFQLKGG